jgi:glycosyltransferase involved in cell wall biosynthesis
MQRKRIMYIITSSETGGAQMHLLELIKYACLTGHEVALVTGSDGMLSDRVRDLGVRVDVVRSMRRAVHPIRDLLAVRQVRHLIDSFRPDFIHAHSTKAGIVGRLAAHMEGIPCVFTAHGWAFTEGVRGFRRNAAIITERIASRWTSRIITVSEYDRRHALKCKVGNERQLVTVHNGVPDSPRRVRKVNNAVPVVTMVARFAEPKNQADLLRALAPVSIPYRVQFVGTGPTLEAAKGLAVGLGISNRVDFLGERTDVANILADSDIFALVSNWEGLPLTILEAMRAGLPVVASDVGGVSEAVAHGASGFLAPPGDTQALSNYLLSLIRDPDLRRRFGYAGRCLYEQRFSVSVMLERTWQVYSDVTKGPAMTRW